MKPPTSCRALLVSAAAWVTLSSIGVDGKLADRSRIVRSRQASGRYNRYQDNGKPIEGPGYRARVEYEEPEEQFEEWKETAPIETAIKPTWQLDLPTEPFPEDGPVAPGQSPRKLSSMLSGCCYNYQSYSSTDLCSVYGSSCSSYSGNDNKKDNNNGQCSQEGLSFIGLSFSVNTANGNPYSYQLCDQYPMERIIDRNYEYIMSMDEDGWLVGGGYKTFDYSGKMPYIDSSHTELLRIGNLNPNLGGTTIGQVYEAMSAISFPPFSVFPEYLKGGGGHHSNDKNGNSGVPSGDVTLIVSIVETYEDSASYSSYEKFLDDLFSAMSAVGGGPCMDDHDTDPHVSMARGVKYWSAYHQKQYMYHANLEVAVWQAMYPKGVPIGSAGSAAFPPGHGGTKQKVGYGNLYFFFDRANITKAFRPYRDLTDSEKYYATLYSSSDTSKFYSSTTSISFDYSGSGDRNNNNNNYEHNPYSFNTKMAMHDMTVGWDLPPNCLQEGETFFGIPLSKSSESKLQSSSTFQDQFDFEYLTDRNATYVKSFGTNHGWLVGEQIGNAVGSLVDKDTAHIPLFYTGTTNPQMGGMSLGDMIKIAQHLEFGKLYIKPAFVYIDSSGHLQLQFEADPNSALAYLYDTLCKEMGIPWNYVSPSNSRGVYTNCAMHAAGDRAVYGCGPDGSNSGGFCPKMTLAYNPKFFSESAAASYLSRSNSYVDYMRKKYPSGVAVGSTKFCPDGGCLALFLNRLDVYEVFKPDLGGSWVEYNGASMPPTYSPAPTWKGGCDEPHNFHLDKCFRKRYKPKASAVAWDALGSVGQLSVLLVIFMAVTLSISIFLARARKKKRRGESYLGFFFRDLTRRRKKRLRKNRDLEESMLPETGSRRSKSTGRRSSRSRSKSKSRRSKSVTTSKSGRESSRTRSVRAQNVQPDAGRGRRSRSRDVGSVTSQGSRRSGVFDLTVTNPQDDASDKRQQLV